MADDKKSFLKKHVYDLPNARQLIMAIVSEFVGTWFLEFLGCLTVVAGASLITVAVGWGFIVGHIVQVFGPLSGAHVNPGVTLANVILGKMSLVYALIYMLVQFIGAIFGFLVFKGCLSSYLWKESSSITPFGNAGVCTTFPNGISPCEALVFEFFATSFLILIVCSVHDSRNRFHKDSFPLKVAGVIIADVICIGDITGASLNTARSFAPALINNYWYGHWAYWVGPLGAGLITPLFYELAFNFKTGHEPENPAKTQATNEIIEKLQS